MQKATFKLSTILAAVIAAGVLMGCQQDNNDSATELEAVKSVAEPTVIEPTVIEPIDPQTDPIAASKARSEQVSLETDLKKLKQDVLALIGDAKADNISQCRVIGFGSKPCGGPAGYIAASVKDLDEKELMDKVGLYNSAESAYNNQLGIMSNCAVEPKPDVTLEDGVCRLVKPGQGDLY